ncbi:acetyl-CoA carboxylase biotin carboxyl carrier protein [Bittarella massiliensis (ex Durand et al. 2017)]|uniref:acetyl-CoA carboxylase biotin carboxyl carrier protein n=1 Tax=Bittarella massiliensis (ex Durand et al. 2017) TaxID=1720313 RepID=UPI001AA1C12F|nr:acetyl-CoA carboxylase biotin carboxyl carrier protein [Bittarella massiliensis (ex Durand et al. 2017)]MBO1678648.1 acetyl-CoA carboxylase biotin carboxyl carrier protein [Bittarella massiliensis (ex Durand et al. 2017)]
MDIREAQSAASELLQQAKAQGATAVELHLGEFSFKAEFAPPVFAVPAADAAPVPLAAPQPAPAAEEPAAPTIEGTPVPSPIVGTYYSSPSPEDEPFVAVGQEVKKGDVLCIVEAMKMLNEIQSPCDGKVARIYLQNGELVEFGQTVMVIQ